MIKLEGFFGMYRQAVSDAPDRTLATLKNEKLSLLEADHESDTIASALRQRGISRGQRVAVMLRNSLKTITLILGLAKAGIVWVPVNIQLRGSGLRFILEHCDPELIICENDLLSLVNDVYSARHKVILIGELLDECLTCARTWDEPAPTPDDIFCIMYTSGTTGTPKGALVTHGMFGLCGQAALLASGADDGDKFFLWEPLYHVGGAQILLLPYLRDIELVLVEKFSATSFWSQVRNSEATHIHYLGGILQILLKQEPSENEKGHKVRVAWGAGCPPEAAATAIRRFGCEIRECYGMTEASSITSFNKKGIYGSVGKPVPWLSVDIVDDEKKAMPVGSRGQIVLRPKVAGVTSPGYFRNRTATEATMGSDGLYTGDVGSFDSDGNLFFHGRLTDSLRCRGENVSAWEVEHVVQQHPDIEECAVIGVKAEIGEQDIKLFVLSKAGKQVNPAELSAWLAPRLATYQQPRYITFVNQFNKAPSLRIVKHVLSLDTNDSWDKERGDCP